MSKLKEKKRREKLEKPPLIQKETKRLLWGIIFLSIGLIWFLALVERAGPVGSFVHQGSQSLFGVGKFLIPLSFALLSIIFLLRKEANFYLATIFGVSFIVISLLGVLDEFRPETAGLLGRLVGSLEIPFGFWASLVIFGALTLSGILLTFEPYVLSFLKPKEGEEKPLLVTPPPEMRLAPPEKEEKPVPSPAPSHDARGETEISGIAQRAKAISKWQFPSLALLSDEKPQPEVSDINTNAKIIQQTLANFGIPVEMAGVHIGPTVTQYTLRPAQGVKLAKILSLHNDLALALATHPIRIEAPIPGKALVGIEVPNKVKTVVRLRNLLEELSLRDGMSLTVPLGRDVRGQVVFADLAKMPHLMVAGATGSGKSIFIHSVILTFLFRIPPQLLRFLLIDPKRVELSQYEDIPYLLAPVITQGKDAIQALRWAISEMERRYDLLLSARTRDIFSYNEKAKAGKEVLPFIVIFIDELADLMASYGREIESAIVRLSQMARATGIHLVVSTQRPSVEVITGLIKANITSRVAFQVASQVDSRTILDMAGAEKLLGAGDLLFLSPESGKPRRIQASYVDENEVKAVVQFLRREAEALGGEGTPQESILGEEMRGERRPIPFDGFEEYADEFYPDAYEVVVQSRKASASLLQRRLKIGYARAARLLDILEAKGVIGPGKGAKPREVYVSPEEQKP